MIKQIVKRSVYYVHWDTRSDKIVAQNLEEALELAKRIHPHNATPHSVAL